MNPIRQRIPGKKLCREGKSALEGSAIVMALLLIAVAGLLITGWVAVITARSGMVEQMSTAIQRRIALENSKALAQEFMLERVLPSISGSSFSYDLSDPSWGGISVPGWSNAAMLSVQKAAGYNHFNPGNGDGYTLDFSVVVRDGDANPTRTYQIKSRSPLFADTLLSSQTPTLSPASTISIQSIGVAGGAFIWQPTVSMSFTANSYSVPEGTTPITISNSGGTALVVNNMALPRMIANPRNGGASFYTGEFDAIDNTNLAANSSTVKALDGTGITVHGSVVSSTNGVNCDGSGNVTVTLNTAALGNVYIPGEVSTLTLQGQAAANDATADDLPAILIVVDQPASSTRDLTSIVFNQHNSRRLCIAVKKASSTGNLSLQFSTSSAIWRSLLELENTPIQLSPTSSVAIKGGIRSDRSIALSGGTAQFTYESDPKYLERLATRTAWIESFGQ